MSLNIRPDAHLCHKVLAKVKSTTDQTQGDRFEWNLSFHMLLNDFKHADSNQDCITYQRSWEFPENSVSSNDLKRNKQHPLSAACQIVMMFVWVYNNCLIIIANERWSGILTPIPGNGISIPILEYNYGIQRTFLKKCVQ